MKCEVGPNSPFQRPVWKDPEGRAIVPRNDGTSRVYTTSPTLKSSHLFISGLSIQDAGTYTCAAGPLKYTYNVIVHGSHMIRVPNMDNHILSVGDDLQLMCQVDASSRYRNPQWIGPNGVEIPVARQGELSVSYC